MTRGRRLLLVVLQITTAREVAARCGVVPAAVSQWASGLNVPSPRHRVMLADLYRISVQAWSESGASSVTGPRMFSR